MIVLWSRYDGGTRATAFISGGFVPPSLRGTSSGDLFVHVADCEWTKCPDIARIILGYMACALMLQCLWWLSGYATMCKLAGVDPTDTVTIAGAQRPIDRSVCAPTTSQL